MRTFSSNNESNDQSVKMDKDEIMKKLSRVSRAKEVQKKVNEVSKKIQETKISQNDEVENFRIAQKLVAEYDPEENEYVKLIEKMKQLKQEE